MKRSTGLVPAVTHGGVERGASPTPRNALDAATPTRWIEMENCDTCGLVYALDRLWQVVGHGLTCPGCCEALRDEGLFA